MANSLENDQQLSERLAQLESEIASIKSRNRKVEVDKAWELSRARTLCILTTTFVMTAVIFWLIDVERFILNASVATACYFISTQSLPVVKHWWVKHYHS